MKYNKDMIFDAQELYDEDTLKAKQKAQAELDARSEKEENLKVVTKWEEIFHNKGETLKEFMDKLKL